MLSEFVKRWRLAQRQDNSKPATYLEELIRIEDRIEAELAADKKAAQDRKDEARRRQRIVDMGGLMHGVPFRSGALKQSKRQFMQRVAELRQREFVDSDVLHGGLNQRFTRRGFFMTLKAHLRREIQRLEKARRQHVDENIDDVEQRMLIEEKVLSMDQPMQATQRGGSRQRRASVTKARRASMARRTSIVAAIKDAKKSGTVSADQVLADVDSAQAAAPAGPTEEQAAAEFETPWLKAVGQLDSKPSTAGLVRASTAPSTEGGRRGSISMGGTDLANNSEVLEGMWGIDPQRPLSVPITQSKTHFPALKLANQKEAIRAHRIARSERAMMKRVRKGLPTIDRERANEIVRSHNLLSVENIADVAWQCMLVKHWGSDSE